MSRMGEYYMEKESRKQKDDPRIEYDMRYSHVKHRKISFKNWYKKVTSKK